jgi:Tol biopolymer transport system component
MGLTAHATAEGKILGTVAYMSPEQAQSKPVDQRSDIFSLGIVLFEMATGQRPFKGDSSVSVLSSVLKDTPPLVTDLRPELPRDIARIIRQCLAKDPEERYQSAKDLRNDLKVLKEESDSSEPARRSTAAATAPSGVSGPPVAFATSSSSGRRWIGIAAIVVAAGAMISAWWTSAPPLPHVTATRQITNDGARKSQAFTDGSRLYFGVSNLQARSDGGSALAQVSVAGGETIELAQMSPEIQDIDPSGTELLVSNVSGSNDGDLAVMPVLGGSERPVGAIRINNSGLWGTSALWSFDKSHIFYARGTEVRLVESDGSESRALLTAPGIPFALRLSPDGTRLRYSVRDTRTGAFSLWEAGADGAGPRPLLPGWNGARNPCCGAWTQDGRYFVFEADGNLWARTEAHRMFARGSEPVQLTFGPVRFSGVTPSRDGRHLFATGSMEKGRLARYDSRSKQFIDYLGGISAEGVDISGDGRWMVYTAFPEGTLWRSHLDGSERLQLSFAPLVATLPRWSPDGSQVAFFGGTSLVDGHIYLVAATGGGPRRATSGAVSEWDPTWSPDGHHLAFGGVIGGAGTATQSAIQELDLISPHVIPLPGSEGLFAPRWSPDGHYIVALSTDSTRLVLFDVAGHRWTDLLTHGNLGWPSWLPDSKTVQYFEGHEIRRITVGDGRVELVTRANSLHIARGTFSWEWLGVTPDGSPMVTLDAGTHDIYALDWDAP